MIIMLILIDMLQVYVDFICCIMLILIDMLQVYVDYICCIMLILIDMLQVGVICSGHLKEYETWYRELDPAGTGIVQAGPCASFLKKSGLDDDMLGKVSFYNFFFIAHRSLVLEILHC